MRRIASLLTVLAVICFAAGLAFTQDAAKTEEKKEEKVFKYGGFKQCTMCHAKMDDGTKKWEESKHSKALATLATDEAKKLSKDPQKDPACLQCHVTGMGKEGGWAADQDDKTRAKNENVTCEACHGPGGGYNPVMMKAKKDGYDEKAAAEAGLIQKPGKETCITCHNEKSPTFKEFDFEKMLEKIKHGAKLEEEKAK